MVLALARCALSTALEQQGHYRDSLAAVAMYESPESRAKLDDQTVSYLRVQIGLGYNYNGDHPKAIAMLKSTLRDYSESAAANSWRRPASRNARIAAVATEPRTVISLRRRRSKSRRPAVSSASRLAPRGRGAGPTGSLPATGTAASNRTYEGEGRDSPDDLEPRSLSHRFSNTSR